MDLYLLGKKWKQNVGFSTLNGVGTSRKESKARKRLFSNLGS